jgi:hypothetical protein
VAAPAATGARTPLRKSRRRAVSGRRGGSQAGFVPGGHVEFLHGGLDARLVGGEAAQLVLRHLRTTDPLPRAITQERVSYCTVNKQTQLRASVNSKCKNCLDYKFYLDQLARDTYT